MLGLSYKNARELNKIIDCKISTGRPPFQTHDITVSGELVTLHARNIIECVKALYGDPDFARFLIFKPERHYHIRAGGMRHRMYHDMHTADWWWEIQVCGPNSK
jgi:hypothetical protein